MSLADIIIEQIRKEGPLSFRDFMEMCLYYPQQGYYSSAKDKIGESGDYYTSPHFSPLFGRMIARQIEEMWELMDKQPFTIVEYGAGPGTLCRDILASLKANDLLYRELRYCIIEKSASMREREKELLPGKVKWYQQIGDIPDLTGCILSNELIDNFPVHRVLMQEELMEIFVDYNGGFTELLKPATGEVKDYLRELGITLPDGYRTEVNLEAVNWIRSNARALKKGFILTIDYGYPSTILYGEKHRAGTLMCYYEHTSHDDPYRNIGKQDITTHINFSALDLWGSRYGLQLAGFTNQAHFLQALGLAGFLKEMEVNHDPAVFKEKRIPDFLLDMGTRLKVLVQQKGMKTVPLTGLQFARRQI